MSRIAVTFHVPGMTADQYDRVDEALREAGIANPPERLYHVAASAEDGWYVFDVWESAEALQAFAEGLVPILQANGVTPPTPQIYPVHNIIA